MNKFFDLLWGMLVVLALCAYTYLAFLGIALTISGNLYGLLLILVMVLLVIVICKERKPKNRSTKH